MNFLDGVTFDYESPDGIGYDGNMQVAYKYYAELVKETNRVLKQADPGYQISVCVPATVGGPRGVDGRRYDFVSLAKASDFLYVMQYDTRSQVYTGDCVASANCGYPFADYGISVQVGHGSALVRLRLSLRRPCQWK